MSLTKISDSDVCPLSYSPLDHPGFLVPYSQHIGAYIKVRGYVNVDPHGTPDMRSVDVRLRIDMQQAPAPGCLFRLSEDTQFIEVYSAVLDRVVVRLRWAQQHHPWVGVLIERFIKTGHLPSTSMSLSWPP